MAAEGNTALVQGRIKALYERFMQNNARMGESPLSLDTLVDCLVVLHEECRNCKNKKDKHIAEFVEKYKDIIADVRRLRLNRNDFEVLKIIGRGAFGDVQVVRHKASSEIFAMKTLKKAEMLAQEETAFFREERDIMAAADSRWITTAQFAFQDEQNLYLVMQYHQGGDLLSLLARHDDIFEEDMARFYLAETVLAVRSLHDIGWVHRDIKPDNLLIDRNGHVKLADFGSSARLGAGGLVYSKMAVGTPDYIAPEVLKSTDGDGKYGVECDWWSVGVVAFEMLYGLTPFYSESLVGTYGKIMSHAKSLKFDPDAGVSDVAVSLMRGLIAGREERLTFEGIRAHPFFADIKWDEIHTQKPPYLPIIKGLDDTSHFDDFDPHAVERQVPGGHVPRLSAAGDGMSGQQLPFVGFTFTRAAETSASVYAEVVVNGDGDAKAPNAAADAVLALRAASLEKQLAEKTKELEEHAAAQQRLIAEAATVRERLAEAIAARGTAEDAQVAAEREKARLQAEARDHELQAASEREARALLEERLAKALHSVDEVQASLRRVESEAKEERQRQQQAVMRLQDELAQRQAQHAGGDAALTAAQQAASAAAVKLAELRLELDGERERRRISDEALLAFEATVDADRRAMESSRKVAEERDAAKNARIAVLERERDLAAVELRQMERKLRDESEAKADAVRDAAEARARVASADSRAATLQSSLDQLRAEADRIASELSVAKSTIVDLTSEKKRLADNVAQQEIVIATLQAQIYDETVRASSASFSSATAPTAAHVRLPSVTESEGTPSGTQTPMNMGLLSVGGSSSNLLEQRRRSAQLGVTDWKESRDRKVQQQKERQLEHDLEQERRAKNELKAEVARVQTKLEALTIEVDAARDEAAMWKQKCAALLGGDDSEKQRRRVSVNASFRRLIGGRRQSQGEKSRPAVLPSSPSVSSADTALSMSSSSPATVHVPVAASLPTAADGLSGSSDPTKRIAHSIPHRFSSYFVMRTSRCAVCQASVGLGKHTKCLDCGLVFHTRCASSAPATCGLPSDFLARMHEIGSGSGGGGTRGLLDRPERSGMGPRGGLAGSTGDVPYLLHQQSIAEGAAGEAKSNSNPNIAGPGSQDAIDGWVKVPDPRGVRYGWVRQWAVLSGNRLEFYESNPGAAPAGDKGAGKRASLVVEPVRTMDVSNPRFALQSTVAASQLLRAAQSDLPFVFGLSDAETDLFVLAPSMDAKERWVMRIEAAATSARAASADKQFDTFPVIHLPSDDEGLRITANAVVVVAGILLVGAREGLFSVPVDAVVPASSTLSASASSNLSGSGAFSSSTASGMLALARSAQLRRVVESLSLVHALMVVPDCGVLVIRADRTVYTIPLGEIERVGAKPTPIEGTESCHLFAATEDGRLAVAFAQSVALFIFDADMGAYSQTVVVPVATTPTCLAYTSVGLLCGAGTFVLVRTTPEGAASCNDLLDPSDDSLGFIAYGVKAGTSAPMAAFEIEGEILLCFSDVGVFVDKAGRRSRHREITWGIAPLFFALHGSNLWVISSDAVHVRNVGDRGPSFAAAPVTSPRELCPIRQVFGCRDGEYLGMAQATGDVYLCVEETSIIRFGRTSSRRSV